MIPQPSRDWKILQHRAAVAPKGKKKERREELRRHVHALLRVG